MGVDFESLTLTEIIQLQNQLALVLKRRFERNLALAFTDVAGSTAYFARFGDAAGRGLQQLHLDLVQQAVAAAQGRIVDTAGDGAFVCFAAVEHAAEALIRLQRSIAEQNARRPAEHQLGVRVGVHWGPVLTDGAVVSGDAVNLCARVAATGHSGEIRLTRAAFLELPTHARVRCRALGPTELKGIPTPVELLTLEWREPNEAPTSVRVEETGEVIRLPARDVVSFGRVQGTHGAPGNDVVLSLPDSSATLQISRWHFELRRGPTGVVLRPVSDKATEVDGALVAKGTEVPVRAGTSVRLSGVLTLRFLADGATSPEVPADSHLAKTFVALKK